MSLDPLVVGYFLGISFSFLHNVSMTTLLNASGSHHVFVLSLAWILMVGKAEFHILGDSICLIFPSVTFCSQFLPGFLNDIRLLMWMANRGSMSRLQCT